MPHKKENSFVIVILLLTAILCIFIVQIPLQEIETTAAPARGADVAVIGGTTAALLAALEAAENGAQVFLFLNGGAPAEDLAFLVDGGVALAGTPPQKKLGIEFGADVLEGLLKEQGGGINDPVLLRAFVSAENLYDVLSERSGLFFDYLPQPQGRPYLHFTARDHAADFFRQNLLRKIQNAAIVIGNENETVKEFLFSPQGCLEAILLENNRGKYNPFYIQAVILADGACRGVAGAEPGYPPGNLIDLRAAEDKEGGHCWAADLGLDVIQASCSNTRLLFYAPLEEKCQPLPLEPWVGTYFFNAEGQILPWVDSTPRERLSFILNSPPGGAYLIAPEEPAVPYAAYFRSYAQLDLLRQAFPWGKLPPFAELRPWSPCFVAPLRAEADYALGGISITPQGEVKKDGLALKGLYAAGEIVGGLHGETLLPGMALSETLFSAKLAGNAAAVYSRR